MKSRALGSINFLVQDTTTCIILSSPALLAGASQPSVVLDPDPFIKRQQWEADNHMLFS